jgi:anti-sigma factor RsiW
VVEQISKKLRAWLGRHPGEDLLMALHDGELSGERLSRILSHIDKCPDCRLRSDRIERSWSLLAESHSAAGDNPSFPQEMLLSSIRDAIHTWSAANLSMQSHETEAFFQSEAGRRMAFVLGIYLGRQAAAALLGTGHATPPSKRECLVRAGSTLSALLGARGAMAVEAQLLRIIDQLPESAAQSFIS